MSRILLIRHATCDPVGVAIAGRRAGISLNAQGREEASRLAERLASPPLDAIYSSPIERARETAELVAARHGQGVILLEALTELDFGDWTGQHLTELESVATWQRFNTFRSGTRIPNGELMAEAQVRAVRALLQLHARHPAGRLAVVSHGDVIKGAIAFFLGVPLDLAQRLVVDTGSVSTLEVDERGTRLIALNDRGSPA